MSGEDCSGTTQGRFSGARAEGHSSGPEYGQCRRFDGRYFQKGIEKKFAGYF